MLRDTISKSSAGSYVNMNGEGPKEDTNFLNGIMEVDVEPDRGGI